LVMKNWAGLLILGLGLFLGACSTDEGEAITPSTEAITATPTRPSEAVTKVLAPTPSPVSTQPATATPVVVPTATEASPVTPTVRIEEVGADGTCVKLDETVTVPTELFKQPDLEVDIEAYLNAGGSIDGLPRAFVAADADQAIRLQTVSWDVTGSGVPDLLIGVTIPYVDGGGETHLLFFRCAEGQYEGEILFRRAGAGSRMEGLYEGGGVEIKSVGDVNGNEREDVFFSVNWPEYGEHYLLEWEGSQFVSLIAYPGLLGEDRRWIETYGEEIEVVDMDGDGDGVYEIVVNAEGDDGEGERIVWRWNGEHYSID
jgi:hypothetical protein